MAVQAAQPPATRLEAASPTRSVLTEVARFSRRNTLSALGGVVGMLIIVVALAAPLLAPYDPLKADFRHMNKPPNAEHLLGTDQVGRDTLSRVIYGSRTSLFVAFSAVILGTTVGSLWGVACGYLRGRFDLVSQRIMVFHVLPQCLAPYLVLATAHLGAAIVIEAALGFLGVGVPPPTPTWGNMLADSITALVPPWWLAFFPGLAITVTVLAFNLLGDGIRDTLDPRLSPAFLRMMAGGRRG